MSSALLLAGKSILITRSRQQAGRLAEALEAHGARLCGCQPSNFSPESYAHLDSLLEDIASFHWLIVTSVNGVAALADRIEFLRIPRERLAHLRVVAIGPATAAAATRIGLTVAAMPKQYVAEAVVAMLKDKIAGQRVLLARARIGRDVIPVELRRCGADICVAEAYRTVVPSGSIEQVQRLFAPATPLPDAVTFTSSSTVNNFFTLAAAAGVELPHGLPAVSIGPVTTDTLRQHHWEPARQAAESSIPGVVEACVALLAPGSGLRPSRSVSL